MELSDDTFTIVVTDDDADGSAIRELAVDWHRQGLLKEFAIVSPASVTAAAHGPALVHASVFGHDGPVELMRHLGSRRRRLIRLIVLHPLTHEDSSAEALVRVCEQVATLVKRAMPMGTTPGNDGVSLQRMNLLVPETDLAPQQLSILQPGWEVNAVVSPEDRPDLDRLNMFIRASDNLHGHALAAAATVGGLWLGMDEAAFDRTEPDSTTGSHDVIVIRCQAKLIVGDDRAARLARAAVSSVAGVPDGAVRYIKWGFVSDRPTQLVEQMLDRLMCEPDWIRPERQIEMLTKSEVSLGRMIGDWVRFQGSLPLAAIGFLGAHAQGAVERGVTNAFVGAEAGEIGRVAPVTPVQAALRADARINELSRVLAPRRLEEDAATWGQSTPAAWRTLRELSIGLVDGSELPADFSRQRRAELDEVLPPSYVVPPPAESGPLTGRLRGVDVAAVATMATELVDAEPTSQAACAASPAPSVQKAAEADAEPLNAVATDAPVAEPAADEPAKNESPSTAKPGELSEWVDTRRQSLLWKLASRVYENRRDEQSRANVALEQVRGSQAAPPTEALVRARKLLITSWVTSLALIAVGIYLIWARHTGRWVSWLWDDLRGEVPAWVVLVVLIFLAGGHQYYRALRKYEWQVRLRLHALRVASNEYVAASHQEKRWALMYQGVLDWSDILAELLHKPWVESTAPVSDSEIDPRELPAAVALAVPAGAAVDPPPDLVAEAVEAVCVRGWLRGEFDHVVSRSYANNPERNARSGDLPADLDLGLRELGPRAELLKTIRDPHGRELATLGVHEVIAAMAAEEQIRTPPLKVRRIGEYSGNEIQDHRSFIASSAQPATPFAADVFADQALVAQRHKPHMTALTLPPGVDQVRSDSVVVHRSAASLATRVDISQTLQASEVKLFLRPDRVAPAASQSADEFN